MLFLYLHAEKTAVTCLAFFASWNLESEGLPSFSNLADVDFESLTQLEFFFFNQWLHAYNHLKFPSLCQLIQLFVVFIFLGTINLGSTHTHLLDIIQKICNKKYLRIDRCFVVIFLKKRNLFLILRFIVASKGKQFHCLGKQFHCLKVVFFSKLIPFFKPWKFSFTQRFNFSFT